MKTILLTSLLFLSSMAGCNKKLSQFQAFIEGADQFTLYEIDQFATPVDEQMADKNYFSDYQVYHQSDLSKEAVKELKMILKDSMLFTNENVRTCPFIGKYGLAITNKKSEFVHVILSNANCPKCQVQASNPELAGDFDLTKMELYKVLEKGQE